MKIWDCKIGEVEDVPAGSDAPMRRSIREAYTRLTGREPNFIFSGWGGQLTPEERESLEHKFVGHYVPSSARGELCGMCYRSGKPGVPATHKIGEEFPIDAEAPQRHNLTQYVCCSHFSIILGPLADEWCSK